VHNAPHMINPSHLFFYIYVFIGKETKNKRRFVFPDCRERWKQIANFASDNSIVRRGAEIACKGAPSFATRFQALGGMRVTRYLTDRQILMKIPLAASLV
jgi:hypothetical protein